VNTTGHLDYLSVTFPAGFNVNRLSPYLGDWLEGGNAPHGWEWKRVSKLGAYAYGGGDPRMMTHVTMGGIVLQAVRSLPVPDKDFLMTIASMHGRCTRVDVCVNMMDADCTVQDLWDLAVDGRARMRAKPDKRYKSPDGQKLTNDGFYIGAPSSDKRLRVYDKAVELNIAARWVRVELQTNKKKANGVQGMLTGADSTRGAINALIKDFCLFFHPSYTEALSQLDGEIPTTPRKEEAFWKWLRLQVVPAMARRQKEHPEEDVIARIEAMLDEACTNLTKL